MCASPAFTDIPLAETREETAELLHLAIEPGRENAAKYTTPGQYVQIQGPDGKPGFFAIASGPGRSRFEFLIKRGGGVADALAAKTAGDALAVSEPAGKGFPLNEARGNDLYLVGMGSGLAPLRAVVHAVLDERDAYKGVSLYIGVRKADGFPYAKELDAWNGQGIQVHRVCSQPESGSWSGHTGHVQDALREQNPRLSEDACLFACGKKEMVEDLKVLLPKLGGSAERVFLNF